MKQLNMSTLNTRCTSILNAVNEERLQETFVNIVYQALVHGNFNREFLVALRDSKAPGKFKSAVGKYMPVKYVKADNTYVFDSNKRAKLITELCLRDSNDFELVAAALPLIFADPGKGKAADTVDKVVSNVARRLTKLDVAQADGIAELVRMMAERPELVGAIAKAVLATDEKVAEQQRIAG